MIGTTVSHYKILEKLGEGGMGVVYRARDQRLERDVALKFLPRNRVNDPELKARFEREAVAAAALNHPNICTVYEVDEQNGEPFISMEVVDGRTLSTMVEDGPLEIDEAIEIVIQAAKGLASAHGAGIVHRDVKSANIMVISPGVDHDMQVKVMDFGLAQLAWAQAHLTKEGSTVGTMAYMAPEQAEGGQVDRRADIWALGVVFYEMLTGQHPFQADYDQAIVYSILNEDPEPPSKLRKGASPVLDRVIAKALAKDPNTRYQNLSELLADLSPIRASSQVGNVERPKTAKRTAIVVAAALVLGIAAATWLRPSGSEEGQILEIQQLAATGNRHEAFSRLLGVSSGTLEAPELQPILNRFSTKISIDSEPPGADVFVQPYGDSAAPALALGRTPIPNARVMNGFWHWRFEKPGFSTAHRVVNSFLVTVESASTLSAKLGQPGGEESLTMLPVSGAVTHIRMTGVSYPGAVRVGDFEIGESEVTNRAFQRFVSEGGYRNQAYWKHPFVRDGQAVAWEAAMSEFVDSTGQPGPATWAFGAPPKGEDDLPVQGVSWYEAKAFAQYIGRELPTIFHWYRAAGGRFHASLIAPHGNLGGDGPAKPGTFGAVSAFGSYDMYGNVWEWTSTPADSSGEFRYALGGSWKEPMYRSGAGNGLSAFDRFPDLGLRLAAGQRGAGTDEHAFSSVPRAVRDFSKLQPATDEVFAAYAAPYGYDATPLDQSEPESISTSEYWVHQRAEVNAAYDGQRMPLHVFLPVNTQPPYQVVVLFPGAGPFRGPANRLSGLNNVEMFVRMKRAVVYPEYAGSYSRSTGVIPELFQPNDSAIWRDHVIKWSKDVSRALDYINTRPDLKSDAVAYAGYSRGTILGVVILGVEHRFQAAILTSGGFAQETVRPEVDQIHFASRIRTPLLVISGRYDFTFPFEQSIRPMLDLLATPVEHRKHVLMEGGHGLPPYQIARETGAWLDRHLGPVQWPSSSSALPK